MVDVAVLGRKQTVPDEVRALAQAKVAKLGRLTPVLERAEVRLTEDRDAPGAAAQGVRGDHDRPRAHPAGQGRRRTTSRWRSTWWWTSSSTRSSG